MANHRNNIVAVQIKNGRPVIESRLSFVSTESNDVLFFKYLPFPSSSSSSFMLEAACDYVRGYTRTLIINPEYNWRAASSSDTETILILPSQATCVHGRIRATIGNGGKWPGSSGHTRWAIHLPEPECTGRKRDPG